MKLLKVTALTLVAAAAMTANANVVTDTAGQMADGAGTMFKTVTNPGAVSAEIGSLGYGANFAWGANEYTEIQAGWTGGDIVDLADPDLKVKGVKYEAETDFSTPYIGVQLRPMKNWLTVGMGVMYMGDNSINATAKPDIGKKFKYQGVTYQVTGTAEIDASLEFENTVSPYVTLGFRPNITNRFGLFGEIGAAYTGGFDTTVKATGDIVGADITADDLTMLEERARQEIEDEISDYDDWYPIVKVGATYRF